MVFHKEDHCSDSFSHDRYLSLSFAEYVLLPKLNKTATAEVKCSDVFCHLGVRPSCETDKLYVLTLVSSIRISCYDHFL